MEENDSSGEKPAAAPPTREQLRAHNREQRLAQDWAHKCPKCPHRKFTTVSALKSHVANYHGGKVE